MNIKLIVLGVYIILVSIAIKLHIRKKDDVPLIINLISTVTLSLGVLLLLMILTCIILDAAL